VLAVVATANWPTRNCGRGSPTGAGEPKVFPKEGPRGLRRDLGSRSGKRILITASEPGHGPAALTCEKWMEESPGPWTPVRLHIDESRVRPDGTWGGGHGPRPEALPVSIVGRRAVRDQPASMPADVIDQVTPDGRYLYVHRPRRGPPFQVYRLGPHERTEGAVAEPRSPRTPPGVSSINVFPAPRAATHTSSIYARLLSHLSSSSKESDAASVPATKLGPLRESIAPIGAGGMGEVYPRQRTRASPRGGDQGAARRRSRRTRIG
jgi:hypothetical protein